MRDAFTLVEVMIVVAIIGLLAVLAIPSFMKSRETSYAQKQANNCRVVESAKDRYLIDNNLSVSNAPTFSYANLSNYLQVAQADLEMVGGKTLSYGTGATPATFQ